MDFTRREFGRLALAGLPAAVFRDRSFVEGARFQAKPNSLVSGVQLGVITYSYRSMSDQTAEATLKYVVDSGISAIEFMGGPVERFAGAPSGRGGGRGARAGAGGGGGASPERQEAADALRKWRASVSMEPFQRLRKLFNDAGVTIYAWKQLSPNMSDEEVEYVFNVAEALGCTHTTLELPGGPNAAVQLKRVGDFAARKKIYAAYHTHLQGSLTAFDEAFGISRANLANVDLGHYVAAGGDAIQFLEKFHDRIASFHLKDRTRPERGALNLPWGTGDTPIREILQLVKKNTWKMPATIELEYPVPRDSDAVKEVAKCLQFCREALA
jgi:sugar phosphate isomerase/epimerase